MLLNLEEHQIEALASALAAQQPTSRRRSLRANVASKVESIEESDLNAAMDALISLFALRDSMDTTAPEFASTIANALEDSGAEELAFPDPDSRRHFEAALTRLLGIEPLEVAAKAIGLAYEQDHIIHGRPRVLTDVRPIFGSGPTDPDLRGAMVVHTLRLDYHVGARVEELFLALDADELDELIQVLERARSKAHALESYLRGSDIHYVDSE